jgi:phospholipid/cholesterol/gamma-HCH transport system substrate-binding protein
VQKSAPSVGRILVMVGFALSCFGLLLFLWLAFGGPVPLKPKGYRFTVSFKEAGQLAQEADVRISGVPVGKVKTIVNDKRTGSTDATIELKPEYAPMPRDARATLRQKTLLGETYVELSPGRKTATNGIPDGGRLGPGRVASTVELDEIFRAFDAKTRLAFQDWMQTQAVAISGRGRDLNDAFGTLRPFVEDTSVLVKILNGQEPTVRGVVRNTGTVFSALTERRGQLRGLVSNSNRVFATTAARNRDLQEIFQALPTFERESATTVNRLTTFSEQTNPLITQLRPAARQLSPTLQQLSALSPELKSLFVNLGPAITASKAGLPATEEFLEELPPPLAELDPPLRQLTPPVEGLGQFKSELSGIFANSAAATQAVADGKHYLRTTNPLNPEGVAVYQKRLPTNRPNAYEYPRMYDALDKGGVSQFETRQCTGSNPFPTVSPLTSAFLTPDLLSRVVTYAFNGSTTTPTPAPACIQQAKFPTFGVNVQYPHVRANTRLLGGAPFSTGPTPTRASAASVPGG